MKRCVNYPLLSVVLLVFCHQVVKAQWDHLDGPIGNSITALAANNNKLFAGTDSGLYFSTDNGLKWNAVYYGYDTTATTTNKQVKGIAASGSDIYVAGWGDIYRSMNNGDSWQATILDSTVMGAPVSSITVNGKDLFIVVNKYGSGGYHKDYVYRYSGSDQKWTTVGVNSGAPVISWDGSTIAANGNAMILGTEHSGVFRSVDNGASWNQIQLPAGLPALAGFLSLQSSGGFFLAGVGRPSALKAIDMGLGVYRSADTGKNWTGVAGLPDGCMARCFAESRGSIFVGFNKGVFLSKDSGAKWTEYTGPLFSGNIGVLAAADRYLYAAQKSLPSLWRRILPDISIKDKKGITSHRIVISAGRLSPDDRSLSVEFSLSGAGKASVSIFNASGRKVASLADNVFDAGAHRLVWNAGRIPAGCYMARLQTESAVYVRNFPIIR